MMDQTQCKNLPVTNNNNALTVRKCDVTAWIFAQRDWFGECMQRLSIMGYVLLNIPYNQYYTGLGKC